jgi:uncharacterized membrane protein YkvA (DUF1232 family)
MSDVIRSVGRPGDAMVVRLLIGIGFGLLVAWLGLLVALMVGRPERALLTEMLRLLPDVLRLLRRLAADGSLPGGVRVRLWLLLGYLAMPFDLVPDFLPVLGCADDAMLVAWVLRSVIRQAGPEPVRRHWPGSLDGLAAVWRLCGLPSAPPQP